MHQVTINNEYGMNASFSIDNPNDTIDIISKAKELAENLDLPGTWGLSLNSCRIEF